MNHESLLIYVHRKCPILSVNEQIDFLSENSLEIRHDEVTEKLCLKKSKSIIIAQKRVTKTSPNLLHTKNETMCLDPHFDSDNEDNPRESKPSLQFLRSISLTSIIVWP